jgi:pimeloyl-ACP methyl ester carboxylesterase
VRPAPGDDSPHREGIVRTTGATIHYLDWGGSGPPLVLIAGRGENAHVFDDIAPRLTSRYRVVAITRRGYGQSGRPAGGFDVNTLVDDDLAVLDRLKLGRVYLAAHSIGSHEITRLAVRHPERVARLVYLDGSLNDRCGSSECQAAGVGRVTIGRVAVDPFAADASPLDVLSPKPPDESDAASFDAVARYFRGNMPAPWSRALESNLWHAVALDDAGRMTGMSTDDATEALMGAGMCGYRQEFGALRAPALAIVAMPGEIGDLFPWVPATADGEALAIARAVLAQARQGIAANIAGFQAELPSARTLVIDHSNHYVFVRHQEQVLAALRDFLPGTMPGGD